MNLRTVRLVSTANDRDDGKTIRRVIEHLQWRMGMTYSQTCDFFKRCDPRIDNARFDELCQLADEVQ